MLSEVWEATLKLVLWDIDHTLIATRGVGREIFKDAFEQVTGTPMRDQATEDGMTEPVLFRRTAQLHGITSDRTMFEEFARRSTELHRRRAHDLRGRGHALPGTSAALDAVAAMGGVVQSVVTGNIRAVAEIKLQVFGLDTHILFPYGGYGEDHDDRAELVRTAIARTRAATGADVALADVLLIGDTPADVAAGRAAGVSVLAVATGRTSAAELADAGATATVRDLQDASPLHDLLR
ncbi:HAD family hydrolase [Streptomyces fulvorobeus]|uniref:Haloacid dehalogenase n=1 Tax=Streptomyces fulvorobeus TaxID=284028 RepID=A0A7J0CHS0_9ACTN|nr:haloacid dehalogenase-like hydrolase [Streptomyces fulvorobeus]NYE44780.1 phosphoglycolate phosphatase-like HAD superfamily hydrolase [Streptomyces fulvorobeus]GFN01345.1 haloacid dehalogenase [Streptomyces fulvorobeus]